MDLTELKRTIKITLGITVSFCLIMPVSSTCLQPDPLIQDDINVALTWATLDLSCLQHENISNSSSKSDYNKNLTYTESEEQIKSENKILSRKRRFYLALNPTMTAELRYVLTLFPISKELMSFAVIELPIQMDLTVPVLGDNPQVKEDQERGYATQIFETIKYYLSSFGLDGESCVLRSICDVASITPIKPRGILRDIMAATVRQLMKSAETYSDVQRSSSSGSYLRAAAIGKAGASCSAEYHKCPISFLGLIDMSEF